MYRVSLEGAICAVVIQWSLWNHPLNVSQETECLWLDMSRLLKEVIVVTVI